MDCTIIRRAVAAAVAATLVLAACGDDGTETATAGDRSPTEVTTTTTTAAEGQPSEGVDEGDGAGRVIEVSVSDGEVIGGGRVPVELGSSVTIRVTSDAADHVHLHGYDVMVDVSAGEIADLTFDATIPGVFEVELEDAGILLVELEIS